MGFFSSIKFKIWLCVGIVILGFLVATVVTFGANDRLENNLTNLSGVGFPLALRGSEVQNIYSKQLRFYEDAFLLGDEDALMKGNILGETVEDLLDEMIETAAAGGKLSRRLHVELVELKKNYLGYYAMAKRYYTLLAEGGDISEVQAEVQELGQKQRDLTATIYELNQSHIADVEDAIAAGRSIADNTSRLILILFAVVLVLSLVIINITAGRLLVSPIRAVQGVAARLADGEVNAADNIQIKAQGEVGDLVRAIVEMASKLRLTIGRVKDSSDTLAEVAGRLVSTADNVDSAARGQVDEVNKTSLAIEKINASVAHVAQQVESITATADDITTSMLEQTASTEEIAQGTESLSVAAEEVNSSIVEIAANIRQVSESITGLKDESDLTASSVAEMEASIKQVEQGAMQTAKIAEDVLTDAENGKRAVEETIAGMARIKESSFTASNAIRSFSDKAQNIGEILSVIDNLTDETNLLALNAAIIAAQAGEHGRGFAVVADQIKELADQTSISTKEIVGIIEGVRDESQNAVNAIIEAEKSIAEGESLSLQSGEALNKIVGGVQQAASEMEKISIATREQVQGGEMIRVSMDKVADMVNQILTAIREQETGSKMIISVAERMHEMTNQIKISTREQSDASRNMAAGMEEVNSMMQKVNQACEEQSSESLQIVAAVEGIKKSADASLESTGVVKEASSKLNQQTGILLEAIGKFKMDNGHDDSKVVPIQKMATAGSDRDDHGSDAGEKAGPEESLGAWKMET